MFKTPRRVAAAAAVAALAGSALAGGAVAASNPVTEAQAHNSACRSGLTARQLKHELMVALQRDVRQHYPRVMRARVFRKLATHPVVAYRLVAKWSPVRFHAIVCGVRQPPHQAGAATGLVDLGRDVRSNERIRPPGRPGQLASGLV